MIEKNGARSFETMTNSPARPSASISATRLSMSHYSSRRIASTPETQAIEELLADDVARVAKN